MEGLHAAADARELSVETNAARRPKRAWTSANTATRPTSATPICVSRTASTAARVTPAKAWFDGSRKSPTHRKTAAWNVG